MKNKLNEYETLAGLICELTRNCNQKEDFFAASFNLTPAEILIADVFSFNTSSTSSRNSQPYSRANNSYCGVTRKAVEGFKC
ncbi:hypothetical protein MASR1M45_25640 [Candidatus Kapaibacterium sp.]